MTTSVPSTTTQPAPVCSGLSETAADVHVAVVGGGINGLCSAWELALRGHVVDLFERGDLLCGTSSASTKLLHGGLRYLESGHIRLVREALRERAWWLANVPEHTAPIPLLLPIYRGRGRPRWILKLGLWLYDRLAGPANIARHRWLGADSLRERAPELSPDGLLGAYLFYDGQMDEPALGAWVARQAASAGVRLRTGEAVCRIDTGGALRTVQGAYRFDRIVNAAGAWAVRLLQDSEIESAVQLDHVRGSHLIVERAPANGYLLQIPNERRIFFVLPYRGRTLLGTTEVRQTLDEPVVCGAEEMEYLIRAYNAHFRRPLAADDVVETFAGLRSLIGSAEDPRRSSREYLVERRGALVNVYGGKWTTARALGRKVADQCA
jgi:glycerol-3-phosphate dehydrogenase